MPEKSLKYTTKKTSTEKMVDNELTKNGAILSTFLLVTCVKCLLVPTYHSTDFEVHRNWLAITHSLPVHQWYTDARSQWTLDYPPLFAWFECFLSQFAAFVDEDMLKVDNLNHATYPTVLYQRATVVFCDLSLAYGVKQLGQVFCRNDTSFLIFVVLTLCNMGLLVIDHVHFQYNGFLLGMLFLSMAQVSRSYPRKRIIGGAALFALVLNLKHIYLYIAPAYVVWLLKWYCLRDNDFYQRFMTLGCTVLGVMSVSFGPFVTQLPQVMSRLFPFKRGLVHAYWAANFWSLYIGADKVFALICKRLNWLSHTRVASMTGGLVQQDSFAILPTPSPLATFLLTLVSILPALWTLLKKDQSALKPRDFVRCIIICALSSFIFGWHVHEKAVLTAIIPLCVLAVTDSKDARVFLILSSAGHTAILPLLYPSDLTLLKIILSVTYMYLAGVALTRYFKESLLIKLEWIYVVGLLFVTVYESVVHKFIFGEKLEFLPLALTSVYCALGVIYSWFIYYRIFLQDTDPNEAKDFDRDTREAI